jgi:hypothetical protein
VAQTELLAWNGLPAANNWGQNPYWATMTEIHDDTRDRLIGSAQLKYDILTGCMFPVALVWTGLQEEIPT